MKKMHSHRWTIALATLCLLGLAGVAWNGYSQEAAPPAAKAARAKPRGRLPAYYGDVVTQDQRDKIYSIQATYEVQLAALREQLESLVDKRDAEVEAILSAEQKEQVKKLAADAKAEREADVKLKAAGEAAEAGPAKAKE
jgi:Spy/CpxP family protein refolding chaperone